MALLFVTQYGEGNFVAYVTDSLMENETHYLFC